VTDSVDEVTSRFNSQHHASLKVSCRSKASYTRLINSLYTLQAHTDTQHQGPLMWPSFHSFHRVFYHTNCRSPCGM